MVPPLSRRSLVIGASGGIGVLVTGGYAWNRYSSRHHLRFRPLEGVNRSDGNVALTVTVREDETEVHRDTYYLEPARDGDDEYRRHLPGPWIKRSGAYSIRVAAGGEELHLENGDIVDRLENVGWGSDCARVTIIVTEAGELESTISPSDVC